MGDAVIRILPGKEGGYDGVVVRSGKRGEILHDDEFELLRARLRNAAGTLHPNYFGIDGAIKRFLGFMPGGFKGPRYNAHDGERRYKVDAHKALVAIIPLETANQSTSSDAAALASAFRKDQLWTHMPSLQESTRLKETLASNDGQEFVHSAARFATGDYRGGIAGMKNAIANHGSLSWPIATYLPFLWDPEHHMFLKPNVTRDFAERIGHSFAYKYEASLDPLVYESLLDLAAYTRTAIKSLEPADGIDVQSFIWVVGEYPDDDVPSQGGT